MNNIIKAEALKTQIEFAYSMKKFTCLVGGLGCGKS